MVKLAAARASNSKFAPSSRPVVVVFGGTSGIGAGTVRTFARHTKGRVHIIIIGRSQSGFDSVVATLPTHAESLYEFLSADLVLIRNVRAICDELKTNNKGRLRSPLNKINYLVLSHGAWIMGHPGTEEGLSPMMALGLYGRVRATLDLAPLLEAAATQREDARVVTIGYAGVGGEVPLDDLALKGNLGLAKWRAAYMTYQDIFALEIARLYPAISITHSFPGLVYSALGDNLPFYLRMPYRVLEAVMAITPDECGEWLMYGLLDPSTKTGAHFKNDKSESVKVSPWAEKPDLREKVWNMLVSTGEKIIATGRVE